MEVVNGIQPLYSYIRGQDNCLQYVIKGVKKRATYKSAVVSRCLIVLGGLYKTQQSRLDIHVQLESFRSMGGRCVVGIDGVDRSTHGRRGVGDTDHCLRT